MCSSVSPSDNGQPIRPSDLVMQELRAKKSENPPPSDLKDVSLFGENKPLSNGEFEKTTTNSGGEIQEKTTDGKKTSVGEGIKKTVNALTDAITAPFRVLSGIFSIFGSKK